MTQADLWQPTMIFLKSELYGALGRPITFSTNPNSTFNVTGNNATDTAIGDLINTIGDVTATTVANQIKQSNSTFPF